MERHVLAQGRLIRMQLWWRSKPVTWWLFARALRVYPRVRVGYWYGATGIPALLAKILLFLPHVVYRYCNRWIKHTTSRLTCQWLTWPTSRTDKSHASEKECRNRLGCNSGNA